MAIWKFMKSDEKRNQLADPAFYELSIEAHRDWTPSKNGPFNNCYFECVIVRNADTGDTTFAGIPIELRFDDKANSQFTREAFMLALGVDWKPDTEYNMASAVGKHIIAFVEHNEYQGRITNKVNNKYRRPRS